MEIQASLAWPYGGLHIGQTDGRTRSRPTWICSDLRTLKGVPFENDFPAHTWSHKHTINIQLQHPSPLLSHTILYLDMPMIGHTFSPVLEQQRLWERIFEDESFTTWTFLRSDGCDKKHIMRNFWWLMRLWIWLKNFRRDCATVTQACCVCIQKTICAQSQFYRVEHTIDACRLSSHSDPVRHFRCQTEGLEWEKQTARERRDSQNDQDR